MNFKNHLVDPSYFYDAIEEFAFDYPCLIKKGEEVDDLGMQLNKYRKSIIRGSLQTDGTSRSRSLSGNRDSSSYNFYCKSLYRINIDDYIAYKGKLLKVDSVHDYDEWGVRECSLSMTQIRVPENPDEWVDYIEGIKIV